MSQPVKKQSAYWYPNGERLSIFIEFLTCCLVLDGKIYCRVAESSGKKRAPRNALGRHRVLCVIPAVLHASKQKYFNQGVWYLSRSDTRCPKNEGSRGEILSRFISVRNVVNIPLTRPLARGTASKWSADKSKEMKRQVIHRPSRRRRQNDVAGALASFVQAGAWRHGGRWRIAKLL